MPFASTRRRSRGIVSKESSVVSDPARIWKVENEGIDSMRERYRIKECRMEGRISSRLRLSSHDASDEGIDEEMNEEGERRTRITNSMLKVFNDVIGVPVPRRARSGSKRKSHPAISADQPSSKNVIIGAVGETSPISESELEVANLLCGLTTLHSQQFDASHATMDALLSSPVPESKRRKSINLLLEDTKKPSTMVTCKSNSNGFTNKINATGSVCSLSIINAHQAESSVIEGMMVLSPKLGEDASCSNTGQSEIESRMHALQNLCPTSILAEEKSSPTSPIDCELFSSPDHSEKPSSTFLKQGETQSIVDYRSTEQLTDKEPNQLLQEITSLSSHDEKLDPHISASSVSCVKGCVKKVKYDIDLMAPPDDGEIDAIAKCNSQASHFTQMDIGDRSPNQDSNMLNLDKEPHLKGVTKDRPEEQIVIGGKTGTQDEKELYKTGPKLDSQRTGKDNIHTLEKAGPSNVMSALSTPIPISIPCWPGVRPFGFLNAGSASLSVLPSLQGASRVEGNSTMLHAPLVMLPPKRPGRCATHCFIAQLTHFQQQLTNVNSFWHAAGGGPSGRPYGITSVPPPPPGALVLGGPFIRNPNAVSGGSSVSGSVVTLNSQYPVANCNSLQDHEKGNHSLIQKPHQGAVFLFPASQMKSPMVGAKASQCSESGSSLPTSSVLSTVSGFTSTSSSNLVANVDPRYRTMFKGNYSFSSTPGYQLYSQQHRPSTPLFYGSSGSSHVYSPLQLIQNPSISTGSSSQLRPFLHSPNNSAETIPRSNNSKNVELLHSQRKQSQPMNPVVNQANTALRDHTNRSSEQSHLNNLRKQSVFQTNSPFTSPSTSTHAATSMANSDHFSSKRQLSSEKMSKPCQENISSGKDSPMVSVTTAVKAQQLQFPNLTPIHKNASGQVFFAGSLNVRPTISQQAQLGSSMGLTKMAAGSHAQVSASLQMKSAGEKPTAA